MSSSAQSDQDVNLRLRRYLGARLGPLVVLLIVVTCLSAPLAFYALGGRASRVQAQATAGQVAEVIRRYAEQRPLLWKYDALKQLAHIRSYEVQESIERVEVLDGRGQIIDRTHEDELVAMANRPVIWQSAPVFVNNEQVGEVWVASSTKELRRDATVLLVAFGALGAVLGGLMYWLPMRAMGRAEGQIGGLLRRLGESQAALQSLNENLEQQVEDRAFELKKAYRELQEKEHNLRELSSRAVGMQESERRAIARELHDSAGQAMTAIRIHLQLMNDLLIADDPDGKHRRRLTDLAQRTTSMVDETVEEIRRAVNQLGPAVLDDVGLKEAIERAADDLSESTGIATSCHFSLPAGLEAAIESTCYRVVQEALTNVARHSEATEVKITVKTSGRQLLVEIADDGRGFDFDSRHHQSRGLIGMRERLELLGGGFTVDSRIGTGTTVRGTMPVATTSAG